MCAIIRELAEKHRLPRFKLGWYYSEVGKDYLRAKIRAGDAIEGLDGRSALTEAELDATTRIVAHGGRASVHGAAGTGRRRDHRRAQQRCGDLRGGCHAPGASRGAVVLSRQGAGMRVVLRRTVWRQGDGAGRNRRWRRACHRDASRPALHGRLGRRPCDVRTIQSLSRVCRGRAARHERMPLRADRREDHARDRAALHSGATGAGETGRLRQGRRAVHRHRRGTRSVFDRQCRPDDRLGTPAGARALRRHSATSCITRFMAATA